MPRADRPSTPTDDLAARRDWDGPVLARGVLTTELAAFCQSGLSVVVASRERDGRPIVGRALGCRVDDQGRVRVLLRRPASQALLQAVGQGAGLAVTLTQPSTHRSIQLKAARAAVAAPTASDGAAAEAQAARFRDELVDVGYPAPFATIYCAFERHELAALDFVPEHAFVQTPGPSAGSALVQ
jgi:hypothetical protein